MALVLLFVTVVLFSVCEVSMNAVYRVGDSAGWTMIDHPDYKRWASTKRFHVGDTLIFTYLTQYHDVMEVSHHDYVHCKTNSAKAVYHTGSDSVSLTKPGEFYFICSNDGHCSAGQKLHIKSSSNNAAIIRNFYLTIATVFALCIYKTNSLTDHIN
ncbi:mavicyanin [Arachis hypogaea]|uniref:mavicyanin n=1 Tax=Arachis hypogaea TaxID=3818 RepID=UPI003B226C49